MVRIDFERASQSKKVANRRPFCFGTRFEVRHAFKLQATFSFPLTWRSLMPSLGGGVQNPPAPAQYSEGFVRNHDTAVHVITVGIRPHAAACISPSDSRHIRYSRRSHRHPQRSSDNIHICAVIRGKTVELFTNLWYNNHSAKSPGSIPPGRTCFPSQLRPSAQHGRKAFLFSHLPSARMAKAIGGHPLSFPRHRAADTVEKRR